MRKEFILSAMNTEWQTSAKIFEWMVVKKLVPEVNQFVRAILNVMLNQMSKKGIIEKRPYVCDPFTPFSGKGNTIPRFE